MANKKNIKKSTKESKKGVPQGVKPSNNSFSLRSKCFFLTYKGISDSGQKVAKIDLADYLLKNNIFDLKIRPEKYLVCEQTYEDGTPHFHVILIYSKRKEINSPNSFDYLDIHPNIQVMRNLKAALQYVYKEDPNPLTNMDVLQQKRIDKVSHTKSLYEFLQDQMMKDPFDFNPIKYCLNNNLTKQIYKANYTKALTLLKRTQEQYCNKLLFQKPGFKYIDRPLIQSVLTPSQLKTYDSWKGYQIIVDFLNQVNKHRFARPAKSLNLLITGKPSVGKSALVWQSFLEPHLNPLNLYCSIYPMGMKDWFPEYRSNIYDIIYWNQTKLTSYSYDIILQLLDGSPVNLPAKGGGHKKIDNPLVIMTSNMTLE